MLVDKNWVSSRKPNDIPAFNREIIGPLSDATKKDRRVAFARRSFPIYLAAGAFGIRGLLFKLPCF